MEDTFHYCTLCSYSTTNLQALTSHICKLHKSHPKFHVYCTACLHSYTKWDSYRKHIHRGCKSIAASEGMPPQPPAFLADTSSDSDSDFPPSFSSELEAMSTDPASQQWHEAAYILNIKEPYFLSQAAVDQVVSSTKDLFTALLRKVLGWLKERLAPNSYSLVMNEMGEISNSLFNGLCSEFLQKKFFREHFHLIVS